MPRTDNFDPYTIKSQTRLPSRFDPNETRVIHRAQLEPRMAARVYRATSDQTISSGGGGTLIQWNGEEYDVGGFHDNAVSNTKLTIPGSSSKVSGIWLIHAQIRWASNIVGDRSIRILKNASVIAQMDTPASFTVAGTRSQQIAVPQRDPIIGDFYEVQVLQTSGGDLAIQFGLHLTFFDIVHLW